MASRVKGSADREVYAKEIPCPPSCSLSLRMHSRRISRGVSRGSFKPIVVGSLGIAISHLQFADGTQIFGENDSKSWENLLGIVKEFCDTSGLTINIEKSNIVGINCSEAETAILAGALGCKEDK